MATSLDNLHIRSSDLLSKEPLDYGGFGEVFLCYHRNLGKVVLKSVFTGCLQNEDSKKSLLEEGSLMNRLCHERVVKLLGVIMEDRYYSLVMELIPKGNLHTMLQQVQVPISIKGRIISEILEGMIYLTANNVIHKDLKPENILLDMDFHIKIADLGLATCQSWSKLTREEIRRKSRSGAAVGGKQGGGTLSYMAPEHLEDINARSTEKSDVYSFAIVLWVILTGRDPYENARNEDQICVCVRSGNRPAEDLIAGDTPKEMVALMKSCWQQEPQQRPTFKEGYKQFFPFYKENLEDLTEMDSLRLREVYEGPEVLVEKIKSLSIPCEFEPADGPAPLLSSERSEPPGPVEASIEDLHYLGAACPIQTDAQSSRGEEGHATLEHKLDMELQYHKHGSYSSSGQPGPADARRPEAAQRAISEQEGGRDLRTTLSSVRPATGDFSGEDFRPSAGLYESMASSVSSGKSRYVSAMSSVEQRPDPLGASSTYDRQKSWPAYPVPATTAPDLPAGLCYAPSKIGPLQDTGSQSLFIQNASAIQIGNYNSLSIRGANSSLAGLGTSQPRSNPYEDLLKYDNQVVTEEHLDILRASIGASWKHCARRLGLRDVEVEAVDHDYSRDGLQEKVHQMLERWRMKEGSAGCTVGKLRQALDGLIAMEAFGRLLRACKKGSSSA